MLRVKGKRIAARQRAGRASHMIAGAAPPGRAVACRVTSAPRRPAGTRRVMTTRSLRCAVFVPIAAAAQPPQSLQAPQSPQSPQSPQAPQSPQSPQSPQPPQSPQSPQSPQPPQPPQPPQSPQPQSQSQSQSQPQSQSQSQSRRLLRASCLSRSRHAQDSPQSPRLFHLSNLPHLSSAQFCQLGSAAHGDYTLCAR
ncbi:hypothetical protein F7R25_30060 [Burkholderia stagnalis]|uniref:Uncharacterized protein n=3 Tax=Burkholderia stagnalis TaxID=1503054 RepID=A0A6L3MNZ9_9BURK|nr:hypothetical protein F7R25_30060 [Burkholderia stagnalis]